MVIRRLRRDTPDQVFLIGRNVSGSTMSVGHAVAFVTLSPDLPGVEVTYPDSTMNPASFAGVVADFDILDDQYGLIQIYGYHSSIYVFGVHSSNTGTQPGYGMLNTDTATVGGAGYLEMVEQFDTTELPLALMGGIVLPMSDDGSGLHQIPGFIKAL